MLPRENSCSWGKAIQEELWKHLLKKHSLGGGEPGNKYSDPSSILPSICCYYLPMAKHNRSQSTRELID